MMDPRIIRLMKPKIFVTDWYEDLPEPCRSQAIENYYKYIMSTGCMTIYIGKNNTMDNAINCFVWEDTPQKADYWCSLHAKYYK